MGIGDENDIIELKVKRKKKGKENDLILLTKWWHMDADFPYQNARKKKVETTEYLYSLDHKKVKSEDQQSCPIPKDWWTCLSKSSQPPT